MLWLRPASFRNTHRLKADQLEAPGLRNTFKSLSRSSNLSSWNQGRKTTPPDQIARVRIESVSTAPVSWQLAADAGWNWRSQTLSWVFSAHDSSEECMWELFQKDDSLMKPYLRSQVIARSFLWTQIWKFVDQRHGRLVSKGPAFLRGLIIICH